MYDAIIVGARCAGASTAMLLARHGHRVLLVDRGHFPSDLTSSTHLVWPSGAAQLQRWGLLDSVAASGCPPLSTMTADLGDGVVLTGTPPAIDGVSAAYAPRRIVLDQILVDAAVAAGAELREGCSVEELTAADGRVTGVAGRTETGASFAESARIVIGADGMNSRVARLVHAAERDPKPLLMGTWFSYWRDVPVDGIVFFLRDYRLVYAWPTNDGLTLVGVDWAAHDYPTGQHGAEAAFFTELASIAPGLAEQVHDGQREQRWIGGPPIANIVRQPYGPGWALVGDAGYLKDFGTAQGISDAFRDAAATGHRAPRHLDRQAVRRRSPWPPTRPAATNRRCRCTSSPRSSRPSNHRHPRCEPSSLLSRTMPTRPTGSSVCSPAVSPSATSSAPDNLAEIVAQASST